MSRLTLPPFLFLLVLLTWGPTPDFTPGARAQGAAPGISGTVVTAGGAPVEFATITLHRAADSVVAKTEFSSDQGLFRFERAAAGRYRVSVSQVGFARYWSAPFELGAAPVTLPAATLQTSAATALKEVVVVGQKPLFERLADRTVVNVEGSTLAAGNTTLDVLARAPGVTVENDNLALRGREGLLVLIDGKRQPMTGAELANFLRSLPAEQLKSIELITNPPAKYDAQGSAGIIAINLRKDQRLGTNGSANLSYGYWFFGKFTGGFTGNHRRRNLNLFGTYTYTRRAFQTQRNTYRYFYQPEGSGRRLTGTSDQRNLSRSEDHFNVWRVGADYNLSASTVVGMVFNGFAVPGQNPGGWGRNTSTFYNAAGEVVDYYTAVNSGQGNNPNYGLNLNLRQTFPAATGKRELTADADYALYLVHRLQSQTTFFGRATRPDPTVNSDQTSELHIQSVKADYTHSLSARTSLEGGAKVSRVYSDNDVLFQNTESGQTTTDLNRTNRFRYDEVISAAYVNLSRTVRKLNVQAGLRAESTNATGKPMREEESFRRDYFQLFPSTALKYTLSERHEMSVSLSRRIQRPSYNILNPFRSIIDPTTSYRGNPNVRPETSYNLELSHTFRQKFTTALTYSATQDPIIDVAQPETPTTTVATFVNLDRSHYLALTLTAPVTVGKWLSIYNNAVAYYSYFDGSLAGTALRTGRPALLLTSNSTFTLGKGWTAELNGTYRSQRRYGFFDFEANGQVGVGVQKSLWDRKANVRLAATDVFLTSPLYATSRYNSYQENLYLRRESRVVTLSFSWQFGNDKLTPARRSTGGAEDERRRAQ